MALLQRLKEPSSWAAAAAAFGALFSTTGNLYHAGFAGLSALLGFFLPEQQSK
jgi:hypothetical protein